MKMLPTPLSPSHTERWNREPAHSSSDFGVKIVAAATRLAQIHVSQSPRPERILLLLEMDCSLRSDAAVDCSRSILILDAVASVRGSVMTPVGARDEDILTDRLTMFQIIAVASNLAHLVIRTTRFRCAATPKGSKGSLGRCPASQGQVASRPSGPSCDKHVIPKLTVVPSTCWVGGQFEMRGSRLKRGVHRRWFVEFM